MLYSAAVKRIKQYCLILFLCIEGYLLCAAEPLIGVWENTERFIEFTGKTETGAADAVRMVLKTYYRFVYEDMGTYPVAVRQEEAGTIYALRIRYPQYRIPEETGVWVHGNALFTSFYKKVPHTATAAGTEAIERSSLPEAGAGSAPSEVAAAHHLEGFWIEQGSRNGILIYQQEAPAFFDAFFFKGSQYVRFRYWRADIDYKEKNAELVWMDDSRIAVPKFIRRSDAVYSCITDNGSKLKNYEKGVFFIGKSGAAHQLTVTPQGGGPGTHAVGDVYPDQKYPQIQALPLYYDEKGVAFAFGTPFLIRSSISNLPEEIKQHNSLKRPPPEPLLKADELDFYWERIKEIRSR